MESEVLGMGAQRGLQCRLREGPPLQLGVWLALHPLHVPFLRAGVMSVRAALSGCPAPASSLPADLTNSLPLSFRNE